MTKNNDTLELTGDGAAYVRVSDDQQDTLRQYEAIHAFEKRHGVTIPTHHWFKDEGWARDTADRRPDFQRLMKLAEAGGVKWIVVDALDRFGVKNAKQLFAYLFRLEEAGCRLFDVTGKEWTGEDDATEITAWLGGKQSAKEQRDKSHRVLGGKVAKARLGEWQGGPIRLGFDVACYHRETGAELWRVIFEGRHKRLRVYPDGRTERFDGANVTYCNSPETQVLRLAPSRDKAKVAAAVSMFKRFVMESISFSALAHHLNTLGFRTCFGGYFQAHHVESMLQDPIYLGYYTYNRLHGGKFHRWADGQTVLELNYEEKLTKNDKADWVQSHRLFPQLVDQPTWDAVRRKLEKQSKRTNAPRTAAQYLSGLIFCGNCGRPMVTGAYRSRLMKSRKAGPGERRYEYFCGTYAKCLREKRLAESCCLRNGVFQDTLEQYVERYLEETGKRLDLLLQRPDGDHLTDRLEGQHTEAWQGFIDGVGRLEAYLAEHHAEEYAAIIADEETRQAEDDFIRANPDSPRPTAGKLFGNLDLKAVAKRVSAGDPATHIGCTYIRDCLAAYRSLFDPSTVAEEIDRLEAEHSALMGQWADLPTPRAKEKAKQQFAELEGRIEQLRQQQQNTADVVEQFYCEMENLRTAIAAAKRAMTSSTGERALRQKAEAIRGVVQRIECTFTATGHTGAGWGKKNSRLVSVTIYPVAGDSASFPVGSDPISDHPGVQYGNQEPILS